MLTPRAMVAVATNRGASGWGCPGPNDAALLSGYTSRSRRVQAVSSGPNCGRRDPRG